MGGINDFIFGGVKTTIGNIVAQCPGKQENILLDDADLTAKRFHFDVANIDPVDCDLARCHIIKTRHQRTKCCFACTGWPDKGNRFTRFDRKIDVIEYSAFRAVSKADLVKCDIAGKVFDITRTIAVDNIGFGGQQCLIVFETGDALGIGFDNSSDLFKRLIEHIDQQQEADKPANRQPTGHNEIGPRHQNDDLDNPHAEVIDRKADRHDAIGLQFHMAIKLVILVKQGTFVILIGKGTHYAYATYIFLDPGVEGTDTAKLALPVACHFPTEPDDQPHHQRRNRHCNQRQFHMHGKHQDQRPDKGHDRHKQVFGAMVGDLADFFQILGDACHQMACLLVVVKAEGKLLQMVECAFAHFGFDRDTQNMAPIGDDGHQAGIGKIDQKQSDSRQSNQQPVLFG